MAGQRHDIIENNLDHIALLATRPAITVSGRVFTAKSVLIDPHEVSGFLSETQPIIYDLVAAMPTASKDLILQYLQPAVMLPLPVVLD